MKNAPMMKGLIKSPYIQLPHAFFPSKGGISSGIYASLNCGTGSDDLPENIAANRRIALQYLTNGKRPPPLATLYQIHSADVLTLTDDWEVDPDNRPRADALVTKQTGVVLGILTADCTPVLFIDSDAGVIGAAHAGWKGALAGILENTIAAMEALGASRDRIHAAVGPTIHQQSYEVGSDFKTVFTDTDPDNDSFFIAGTNPDHYQFDLPGFVCTQLGKSGLTSVWSAGTDTYKSLDHFSYRRTTHRGEPDYGRQLSAIMIPA
ncbi:peptidoglycan editing factor PgeF [Kordiimonas pumila]|uniref:Purine nucleoside phosphorylase n=1 Tax=Kordiimonas pumila TaxID=2161677 RepID=A0ABV7D4Y4_9PROT|nr:peptidoglycan editing factor PgeF [Kordiimonas pumila]